MIREGGIGASDCEALGGGLLAQPVNALSSLAYVVVGVLVVVRARQLDSPAARRVSAVLAVLLVAVGVGSVIFHGPQPTGARVLHDLPILLTVILMVAHDAALLAGRTAWPWVEFGAASVAAAVVTVLAPDVANVLTGVLLVVLVTAEVMIRRRRLRDVDPARQRRIDASIVGVALVAGTAWVTGRTGAPLCDPESELQLHGLWHVLSSVVFGLWWWQALGVPEREVERVAA